LVFVIGVFAQISEDVSRICDIIACELAWIHVSYYNDGAKRTESMYRQRIQEAWGHAAHRGWARLLLGRTRDLITHGTAHRGANGPTAWRCRRTRTTKTTSSSLTTPRGGATLLPPRHAKPLLPLPRSNPPPLRGGARKIEKSSVAKSLLYSELGFLRSRRYCTTPAPPGEEFCMPTSEPAISFVAFPKTQPPRTYLLEARGSPPSTHKLARSARHAAGESQKQSHSACCLRCGTTNFRLGE
jgi:hypothetical protein